MGTGVVGAEDRDYRICDRADQVYGEQYSVGEKRRFSHSDSQIRGWNILFDVIVKEQNSHRTQYKFL